MVEEKLRNIDKTVVDKYPIFEGCETITEDLALEKECFVSKLSAHIASSLWKQQLVLHNEVDAIVTLTIEVTDKGAVTILSHDISSQLLKAIPEIEHYLITSITTLPEIKPALKKLNSGDFVAVNTVFIIPVRVLGKLPESEEIIK